MKVLQRICGLAALVSCYAGVAAVSLNTASYSLSGSKVAAFPDVCRSPAPPAPLIPVPYPNIGSQASDLKPGKYKLQGGGALVVLKESNFKTSSGDEAGRVMGIVGTKIKGKAEFVNYSFDVKVEGQNPTRAFDLMIHDDERLPPFPVTRGPTAVFLPESTRSIVVETEQGEICGVCLKNGRITAIYRLQRESSRPLRSATPTRDAPARPSTRWRQPDA